jgi:hypothetical protein
LILDIVYAKYLDYRTGSGQRLRQIHAFIIDILSTPTKKQAIIEEAEVTENEENIKLDIMTLTQISNQLDIIETYHSALISSQLFSVPVKKTKQHLYTLAELCLYGKAKNSFVAYFDKGP